MTYTILLKGGGMSSSSSSVAQQTDSFSLGKQVSYFYTGYGIWDYFNKSALDTTTNWTLTQTNGTALPVDDSGVLVIDLHNDAANLDTCQISGKEVSFSKGCGALTMKARLRLVNFSNAANIAELGLNASFGGHFDRVNFSFTGGVGGAINCNTSKDDTDTQEASGSVNSNTWHIYEIILNSDWTSASFYIDGTLVKTITTNIPDDVKLTFFCGNKNFGAAAAANIYVNYIEVYQA